MNSDSFSTIILIALAILIPAVIILFVVLFFVNQKEKDGDTKKTKKDTDQNENKTTAKSYNKQSIFKFMNFDKIEDNMIIQKSGKRFLMVVECQGINYDLMSGLEKNSVEQGFLQFLNTLRYTIQIYVQTRTVNLTSSINTYKDRLEVIHRDLIDKQNAYNEKMRSGLYEKEDLEKERFEIAKQRNLYEYGVDIISNTERMSLNKNILSKFYYIIIPYYVDETENSNFNKDEIINLAFSELYTRAQSIINSLAVCGINSKILDSIELTELLYAAYNRDESEAFGLQKALNSGYEELYSTAPNVLDKRMQELDKKIEREAIDKANEVVFDAFEEKNAREVQVQEKEDKLDELINQMAIQLIEQNKKSIGEDVAQEAIKKIDNSKKKTKEGGKESVKKTRTTRKRVTRTK